VKPLKWPALKEWKLTPAEVLEMQKEEYEKYWKMANEETVAKSGNKEHALFITKRGMFYRKYKEILKDNVRLQLMVPQKLSERVMFTAHESLLSAHQGVRRTQAPYSIGHQCLPM